MKINNVRNSIINKYKLSTMKLALLWLTNYEACASLKDSFYFVKYFLG